MEKERIRHREKSFLTGKKRMEKLKVLMKYAGISVFEYSRMPTGWYCMTNS